MAQVIAKYAATTNMRGYIYYSADGSGGGVQYEKGTAVQLPKDYASRETNSRYPIISPMNGWMNKNYLNGITPIYETVTDKCTAPSAVSINASTKVLTITGGAGGDLNTFSGYGISWRERAITSTAWGAWSADTVTTSKTVSVTANAGYVRQYRVRTRGSAGASYYSDYVVCETLITGNTANKEPVILLPSSGAVSPSKTPVVAVSCGADAEGDAMTLKRSVNGGAWTDAAAVAAAGGTVYDHLPAMENGTYEIRYKLVDANGAESSIVSVTIMVENAAWGRSIAAGDIISNTEISHRADIEEMLTAVNKQRVYYGLSQIQLTGTVGRFADWGKQMQQMLDAVNQCAAAAGQPTAYSTVDDVWPNAAIINEIRDKAVGV